VTVFQEREELLDAYRSTLVTLPTVLRDVPEGVWREGGDADGEWSIIEVTCHLRDAEERSFARVRHMCEEDRPRLEAYDPAELARSSGYREQQLADALAAFIDTRVQHIAFLESIDVGDWDRAGVHDEVGEISVQQLTAHMVTHDSIHLAQISRRLESTPMEPRV
jgi:DinB superfamily